MLKSVVLGIVCFLVWLQATNGLKCYVCNDAKSEDECNWNIEECAINQKTCFTEIRNSGNGITIKKSCYQKQACNNLHQQSEHQCPRVCALCCQGDLCNTKPPKACSCGLTTRAPPRIKPTARPKPPPQSRKPTPRTRRSTTSKAYHRSTTMPASTTIEITTTDSHQAVVEDVITDKRQYYPLPTSSIAHTSLSLETTTELPTKSTVNWLEANHSTLGSSKTTHIVRTSSQRPTPSEVISTSASLNSNSTFQISTTSPTQESYNSDGNTTTMSRVMRGQTTGQEPSDIKLGAQNVSTTPFVSMVSPALCERMTFVPIPHTNTKILSCRKVIDSKMVCLTNFDIQQAEEFTISTNDKSANSTEYHQCQIQPTNISISTKHEISILCISMSNKSNIIRVQKSLISLNDQSDNATHRIECRLVDFKQSRENADNQIEDNFESDKIERLKKFCGKRLVGVKCIASTKSATGTDTTTPAVKVASGSPTWMIPVIIVAVVIAGILGIIVVLCLLRKTGFYLVRKKVRPNEKDKK